MKSPALLRTTSAQKLHSALAAVIQSAPPLKSFGKSLRPLSNDEMLWLGRAETLVSEVLGLAGNLDFKAAMEHFYDQSYRDWSVDQIMRHLHRAFAAIEIELPSLSGAFIPVGNAFDALTTIQKIFESATTDLLIVDPYLDEKILMSYALFAPEKVQIRLLSSGKGLKGAFIPALAAWTTQHGAERPLTARRAQGNILHDRLIVVDGKTSWAVGQSFNALAARASTSFLKDDPETAALKIAAHEEIWSKATPVP